MGKERNRMSKPLRCSFRRRGGEYGRIDLLQCKGTTGQRET